MPGNGFKRESTRRQLIFRSQAELMTLALQYLFNDCDARGAIGARAARNAEDR